MISHDYNTLIEEENLYGDKKNVYGEITEPFDPKQVDIVTETMVVANIIDRLRDNSFDLTPDFQRKTNIWDDQKQSRLIESLIVRIPLPSFYFNYDDNNDNFIVVDGLQRLWAIRRFTALKSSDPNRLRLVGLEYLTEYNGCYYEDLPLSFQRRIREQTIVAHVIRPGTPEFVRNSIFTRINTGGISLTPAEIKNAIYRGQAANFVRELAHSQNFIRATSKKIDPSRMMDCEFVNRFLAFFVLNNDEYKDNLEQHLNVILLRLKSSSVEELRYYRDSFYQAMDLAYDLFGKNAFKKINKNGKYGKINKPLFECVSVCFARLSAKECRILKENRELFIREYELLLQDPVFVDVITNGTAKRSSVEKRTTELENIICHVLDAKSTGDQL